MIDMDKTYSTKLKVDDSTEKVLHAVQKALDSLNKTDNWKIEITGGATASTTISVIKQIK